MVLVLSFNTSGFISNKSIARSSKYSVDAVYHRIASAIKCTQTIGKTVLDKSISSFHFHIDFFSIYGDILGSIKPNFYLIFLNLYNKNNYIIIVPNQPFFIEVSINNLLSPIINSLLLNNKPYSLTL